MGTKRKLTPLIGEIVEACQPGAFLDAFAGMCSVGSHIGGRRPVWTNDLQHFSNLVSTALFCSKSGPPKFKALSALAPEFERNASTLRTEHQQNLRSEKRAITTGDYESLRLHFETKQGQITFRPKRDNVYDLFVERYAGVYFSIEQCIEIDSFRYAADKLRASNTISQDTWRWLIVALGVGMNRCSSSTGHFAQPLAPKASNIARLARERSKSVLAATASAFDELSPVGNPEWRVRNRVFNADASTLLTNLRGEAAPSVVYADPPYTADHYSRFYHLYDTLTLYDYPGCSGRGRYRNDRAISDFCLPARVRPALSSLIKSCADAGADLILSYPENGLLDGSAEQIPELMRAHYGKSPVVNSISHTHSTMGASKGGATTQVVEKIYKAAA